MRAPPLHSNTTFGLLRSLVFALETHDAARLRIVLPEAEKAVLYVPPSRPGWLTLSRLVRSLREGTPTREREAAIESAKNYLGIYDATVRAMKGSR